MQPQPPRRSTHASGGPRTLLVYDRWGAYGRPVLLLHGLLFDRTMWWPVAAELATASSCTVVAPDLPGHGQTPPREDCPPSRIARDLATLINNLDLHRAPVIVGHATAAPLAHAFASAYATHHVLTLDEPAETPAGVDDVIAAARVSEVRGTAVRSVLESLSAQLSGLEGVLDVLAGLLQLRAGLVGLAFGLEALVVGGLAYAFLDLAADFLSLVVDLVIECHGGTSSSSTSWYPPHTRSMLAHPKISESGTPPAVVRPAGAHFRAASDRPAHPSRRRHAGTHTLPGGVRPARTRFPAA
jgi:pimeloyl-ACP methyl ester carboxylesterase